MTKHGFRFSTAPKSAGLSKKTDRILRAVRAPMRAHLTKVIGLTLYAVLTALHARLNKDVGKRLRAVLHVLSAMVHGRNRHLVAKQSADNTFIVQREVRAFAAQAGCLCVEGGSVCPTQGYQADAKIRSTCPPVIGWTVIMQEDGVTDDAESRFVPLKLT